MVKDKGADMNFDASSSRGTTDKKPFLGLVYLETLYLTFQISKQLSSQKHRAKEFKNKNYSSF